MTVNFKATAFLCPFRTAFEAKDSLANQRVTFTGSSNKVSGIAGA